MASPQTHLAIDGYVDAIPAPGTSWGTATFDLIHSPTDADRIAPDTSDTVYACTTSNPRIADVLLREIQPGDLLRVTGTLLQPDAPARLTVDALEVLDTAPLPVLHGLVLERWGNYATVFDADRDTVPVFTIDGRWIGEGANPDAILDLIDTIENGPARLRPRSRAAHRPGGVPRRPPPRILAADEYAAVQRAQGTDARVVMDLASDQFFVVTDTAHP
ncbi:hypothetical protein AB0F20_26345 [Streptomyces goshikiensis]|uniref:hypothetical protein n=1 Tax=Streptomyces goshikiensis TaxID=1942 RepID=UPI0033FA06DB